MRGRSSQRTPGCSAAARTDPGERTGPLRPDRIGQNVGAALLQQHGGMVDQRNAQLVAFHARRRFRLLDVRNESGADGSGRLVSFHRKTSRKPRACGGVRIEEALSVKVLRKWRCAGTVLHESYLLTFVSRARRRSAIPASLNRRGGEVPPIHRDVPRRFVPFARLGLARTRKGERSGFATKRIAELAVSQDAARSGVKWLRDES